MTTSKDDIKGLEQSLAKHDAEVIEAMLEVITKTRRVSTYGRERVTTWTVKLEDCRDYANKLKVGE